MTAQVAKRVAVICAGLGGAGAVANVAMRQMTSFELDIEVHYISDSFPAESMHAASTQQVRPRKFRALRRLAHVPRELSFAGSCVRALRDMRAAGLHLDWVIAHSHVVAARVAGVVHAVPGSRLALVVHGDVFDRPVQVYGRPLTALYRWAAPRAYARCDRVFALSETARRTAVVAGADPQRVHVLPNAVAPAELGLSPGVANDLQAPGQDPVRLLFVGRLSHEKGLDILLEACARLQAKGFAFALTVIGEGPARAKLESQAATLGLGRQVRFMGQVARASLGASMLAHHAVCMPSRLDSFPLVALETMASGTPLLATPVGALVELLSDNPASLVADNTPEGWAHAIAALSSSYLEHRRPASRRQHKAWSEFTWPAVSDRFQKMLFQ